MFLVSVDAPCGRPLETSCRSPTCECVCVCVCVFTAVCLCLLSAHRHTCVSLLSVWWGVQRAAGGPGRVSKEGRENQRVGGEDPGPGVPGNSTKRNNTALQNSRAFPQRSLTLSVSQKRIKGKKVKDPISRHALNQSDKSFFLTKKKQNLLFWLPITAEQSNGATQKRSDLVRRIPLCPTYTCDAAANGSYPPCKNIWFNKGSISFLSCSSLYGQIARLKRFLCNSIITEMDCVSFPGPRIIFSQAKPPFWAQKTTAISPLTQFQTL